MGHKKVYLECSLCLNRNFDNGSDLKYPCPECGKPMLLLPHRFRPPRKTDTKAWEVVSFLIGNGFSFQHIFEKEIINGKLSPTSNVPYPKSLREAKEFIEKYKDQALKKPY